MRRVSVQLLQDVDPALLEKILRVVVVAGVLAYGDCDSGTQVPDEFRKERRIAGAEAVEINEIGNRSAPSSRMVSCPPVRSLPCCCPRHPPLPPASSFLSSSSSSSGGLVRLIRNVAPPRNAEPLRLTS